MMVCYRFTQRLLSVCATFLLIVANSAFGEESCSTVRLDKDGGPFEQAIPLYDQQKFSLRDTSICYAISASRLIDAYRFRKGDHALKQLTSPLSIALNTNTSGDTSVESLNQIDPFHSATAQIAGFGEAEIAIRSSQGQNACDQRWLENFASLIKNGDPEILKYMQPDSRDLHTPDAFFLMISNLIESQIIQKSKGKWSRQIEEGGLCSRSTAANVQAIVGSSSVADIADALDFATSKQYAKDQLKTFLEKFCLRNQIAVNTPGPETVSALPNSTEGKLQRELTRQAMYSKSKEERKKLISQIEDQRAKGDESSAKSIEATIQNELKGQNPVEISYSSKVLYGKYVEKKDKKAGGHSSVIIGRKWDPKTKQCNFLVQDSYGSCIDAKGTSRYAYPCENGSVWVPESDLLPAVVSITYIP